MSGPMQEYATPDNAIFSGTAGILEARGVPVEVDTWFAGKGAAPVVYLAASSFGAVAAEHFRYRPRLRTDAAYARDQVDLGDLARRRPRRSNHRPVQPAGPAGN